MRGGMIDDDEGGWGTSDIHERGGKEGEEEGEEEGVERGSRVAEGSRVVEHERKKRIKKKRKKKKRGEERIKEFFSSILSSPLFFLPLLFYPLLPLMFDDPRPLGDPRPPLDPLMSKLSGRGYIDNEIPDTYMHTYISHASIHI